MKYLILILLFTFSQCEICVPLNSNLCTHYNNVIVPFYLNKTFDIKVMMDINIQNKLYKRYINGTTAMICYFNILNEINKCDNEDKYLIPPCRDTCKGIFEKINYNVNPEITDKFCDNLPINNCISGSSIININYLITFILIINMIIL